MLAKFWSGLLADALVVFHLAYVLFVLLGQVAILVGAAYGWQWVRNPYFRVLHLVAIGLVALESIFGWACPLTTWENTLRHLAGRPVKDSSFMARLASRAIFLDLPEWFFNMAHIGFAAVVLATLWLVPPRWRPLESPGTPASTPAAPAGAVSREAP